MSGDAEWGGAMNSGGASATVSCDQEEGKRRGERVNEKRREDKSKEDDDGFVEKRAEEKRREGGLRLGQLTKVDLQVEAKWRCPFATQAPLISPTVSQSSNLITGPNQTLIG
jgi:hypothetical protein